MEKTQEYLLDISLRAYNGPLDLLLDLIREQKIDIYDIPISEITDQYLGRVEKMCEQNLAIAGEFMVMASTLVYIKSRMLLPQEDEQEDEEEDPRQDLVSKLLEYQSFREAAKDLDYLQAERSKIFRRSSAEVPEIAALATEGAEQSVSSSLFNLIQAFSQILMPHAIEPFHEVKEELVPIEVKIATIRQQLVEKSELYFDQLFGKEKTKNDMIATFLALLELIKGKEVQVVQSGQFSEILIKRKEGAHINGNL